LTKNEEHLAKFALIKLGNFGLALARFLFNFEAIVEL
jgi:hypothetical protein